MTRAEHLGWRILLGGLFLGALIAQLILVPSLAASLAVLLTAPVLRRGALLSAGGFNGVGSSLGGGDVDDDPCGVIECLNPDLAFNVESDVVLTDTLEAATVVDLGEDVALRDRIGLWAELDEFLTRGAVIGVPRVQVADPEEERGFTRDIDGVSHHHGPRVIAELHGEGVWQHCRAELECESFVSFVDAVPHGGEVAEVSDVAGCFLQDPVEAELFGVVCLRFRLRLRLRFVAVLDFLVRVGAVITG